MPRENRISFEEKTHIYTIDGIQAPRSVTGLLHEYASAFNPILAVSAMKHGREWETKRAAFEARGLGTDDADILRRWEFNGEVARSRGHCLHWQCEQMCNGRPVEEPHSPEFQQARHIYDQLLGRGYEPYRAEARRLQVKM